MSNLDDLDRRLVLATQAGLPLEPRPYHAVARTLGVAPEVVMERLRAMAARGAIRRIAAVPNHYALGYTANGMSVWDVDDAEADQIGRLFGAFAFVSHCYRRPRVPPLWPFNIFAMVHGRDRDEVAAKVTEMATAAGDGVRAHEILYSTRILKKSGLRLVAGRPVEGQGDKRCSG